MAIRKYAAVAIAAALVFGTAGCTFTSPVATRQAYSPSDGGQVNLETVKARNFIYLSNGTQAALFGSLVNSGLQDAEVHLQYTDAKLNEKLQGQPQGIVPPLPAKMEGQAPAPAPSSSPRSRCASRTSTA